ncbi:tryptophan halogenase family protein [Stieleria varia]|uniref:Flavin-dependent tryptophan halogenase RebH n=1 Tax=Stieleria varia TaxID=2528005 RepID=A0A5C6AS78_9BACT|nr:tryptophan halogenase family protein [Stieleria varia]TWU02119.1 Flavin-dependent tryptophan halogenase RebH [Stieleria varia]
MEPNSHTTAPPGTPPPDSLQGKSLREMHIAIVGGGTAGWMSAATLRRRLGCRVTLVESSDVASIGVGEATIPAMVDWIENMGIDEDEFLRRCGGTYKLAIRFDDWVTPEHQYWHPFGSCGRIKGHDLIHQWRRGIAEGWIDSNCQYTDFCLQKQLCQSRRSLRPARPSNNPAAMSTNWSDHDYGAVGMPRFDSPIVENYAFHLDAGLLAKFIQSIAVTDGVTHRVGHVCGVQRSENGDITCVEVRDQPAIHADLYIDCSGFASVLIEKSLQSDWTDWSDQLLCDRAVTARQPVDHQDDNVTENSPSSARNSGDSLDSFQQPSDAPFTICTGRTAGWTWRIPLMHATGNGYVYSSNHLSRDEAESEFLRYLSDDVELNSVRFRVGHRRQSWQNNCVAIGLSSGFIEPLESTGIFLIQRALDELVNCLPGSGSITSRPDLFNRRMTDVYEEIRDFVLLHYVLSDRDDTPFWRDARSVRLPDSLDATIQLYEQRGHVELPEHDPVFAEANHHFIFQGAERLPPVNDSASSSLLDRPHAVALMSSILQRHNEINTSLPSNRQLLQSIHIQCPTVYC